MEEMPATRQMIGVVEIVDINEESSVINDETNIIK